MINRLTLFTATLVQDSALSVSGVDRESSSDRPFAMIDGVPVLSGRGLKGAAVAMARRFFDPLPRSVSEDANHAEALHRSAWEFSNSTPDGDKDARLPLRAGVGIFQKTGARAPHVLYDREVVPAGTRWPLVLRVDWSRAEAEADEAEGILGYVLAEHWAKGRCWLGSDVARGLGWCHLENLCAYRFDERTYETWVTSGRNKLPDPLPEIPIVEPTRSWCFRALEVRLAFGEYRPNGDQEPPWGLDMLAVGPHSAERSLQRFGTGTWARPPWAASTGATAGELETDRALLMEQMCPLLPGASVRGPMRHAFSRAVRAQGGSIQDPHLVQEGYVGDSDEAGKIFGTVTQSSRVLICDARALDGWAAARLHMHAEDEFSAGSYESAKRDGVRLLRGVFPMRIVVEGADVATVEALTRDIDKLVALGALGHLPVGGDKTRGAGWGQWAADAWKNDDVIKSRSWTAPVQKETEDARPRSHLPEWPESPPEAACIAVDQGNLDSARLTLGQAASQAMQTIGNRAGKLVAWWCEPTIDFSVTSPPEIFGWKWPECETLLVDEVAFFLEHGSWRAARTAKGTRWVFIWEVGAQQAGAEPVQVFTSPAKLHGPDTWAWKRFSARSAGEDRLIVREWRSGVTPVGFTLNKRDEQ